MIYEFIQAFSAQTPADLLDNTFIFDALPSDDSIASATVTSDMPSLVITVVVVDSPNVVCWVTGGTPGSSATLTCHVVTTMGREYNRSGTMAIQAIV
jgi:hypothetical protein